MAPSSRSSRSHSKHVKTKIMTGFFDGFWSPPSGSCPKCSSNAINYYDAFFFSPIRTLSGKRRLKCSACRYIWRPSRKGKSVWEKIKNQYHF